MRKLIYKIKRKKILEGIKRKTSIDFRWFLFINSLLILFQFVYLLLRFKYVNAEVPFLYTKRWGEMQLADKSALVSIPLMSLAIVPATVLFYYESKRYFLMYADKLVLLSASLANILLTISLLRIIFIASSPFKPLINPFILSLIIPFTVSFILTYITSPILIKYFKEKGIVTIPKKHLHPAMLLDKPSARGGGLIFTLIFLTVSFVFVGFSKILLGIYIGTILIALLGMLDDYQNTHSKSKLKPLENPLVRLFLLFLVILVPILIGIRIDFINNPFDGFVNFGTYIVQIGNTQIQWVSIAFTVLWFIWVGTVLSWSNGVDGQYGGIVGIVCIVIAVLALRFAQPQETEIQMAKVAIIASGAAWGLMKYNWYPSKIMWGFGAMTIGFIISATSAIIGAKIAIAAIVILIPFLDAMFSFIRRLAKGKNPLKGDTGHLHHFLHKQGWGFRRIAVFYWLTTAIFGIIGIVSADVDSLLFVLTLLGLISFSMLAIIVSLRLREKPKQQQPV